MFYRLRRRSCCQANRKRYCPGRLRKRQHFQKLPRAPPRSHHSSQNDSYLTDLTAFLLACCLGCARSGRQIFCQQVLWFFENFDNWPIILYWFVIELSANMYVVVKERSVFAHSSGNTMWSTSSAVAKGISDWTHTGIARSREYPSIALASTSCSPVDFHDSSPHKLSTAAMQCLAVDTP